MRLSLAGAAVFSLVLLLTSCGTNTGKFLLLNEAKEPIAHASVTICGQTIELQDIQPHESATGSYEVTFDSHYTIVVQFQSGKTLKKETGYVTHGMDSYDEITVRDSDIEITDSKSNAASLRGQRSDWR